MNRGYATSYNIVSRRKQILGRKRVVHCYFAKDIDVKNGRNSMRYRFKNERKEYIVSNKILLERSQYILTQIDFALSDLNKYFTGLEVHRDPSQDECLLHWEKDGGADWFRKMHGIIGEDEATATLH